MTPALPARAQRVPARAGDVAVALSSSEFLFLLVPQDLLVLAFCPRFSHAALFTSGSARRELRCCTPSTAGDPETLQLQGTLRPCNSTRCPWCRPSPEVKLVSQHL